MAAVARGASLAPRAARVLGIVLLAGCGGGGGEEEAVAPMPMPRDAPSRATAESEQLYDAAGKLLASSTIIAGLPIPRGLDREHDEARLHVFTTRVPVPRLFEYFGPRLVTDTVERFGSGAVYRAAAPRDVRGGVVRLDVSIQPFGINATRVTIEELPPAPPGPVNEAELAAQLARDLQRME